MTPELDNVLFEDCLSVEASLPFQWRENAVLDVANQQRAVRMIELAHGFEDNHIELGDEVGGSVADTALLRLEQKLDFTMEMIGSLLAAHRPRPASVSMRLSVKGLCVPAEAQIERRGVAVLHINAMVPEPLELLAEVTQTEGGWIALQFVSMDKDAEAVLERAVFKMHRRFIAALRTG